MDCGSSSKQASKHYDVYEDVKEEEVLYTLFSDAIDPFDKELLQHIPAQASKEEELKEQYSKVRSVLSDDVGKTQDWNTMFVDLRSEPSQTPGEAIELTEKQNDIVRSFTSWLSHCVECILLEEALDIPLSERCVPYTEAGGVAGGKKYQYGTIMIKYAVNENEIYDSTMGGQKSAAAEIRAMTSVLSSQSPLNITLSCAVYMYGHCVVGTALAPIQGQKTLRYGSADAAGHIYLNHAGILGYMYQMAHRLGLAEHRVMAREGVTREPNPNDRIGGRSGDDSPHSSNDRSERNAGFGYGSVEEVRAAYGTYASVKDSDNTDISEEEKVALVVTGVDVEGHVGTDGRLYVVDVARLMPPTPPPPRGSEAHKVQNNPMLYQLFRAEFTSKYCTTPETALSSDAYSAFGRLDHQVHHERADQAFQVLMKTVVPQVARAFMDATSEDSIDISCDDKTKEYVEDPDRKWLRGSSLSRLFHQYGLNMRYLGRVWELPSDLVSDRAKEVLLLEMISRCLKQRFRRLLRHQSSESLRSVLHSSDEWLSKVISQCLSSAMLPSVLRVDLRHKYQIHISQQDIQNILTKGDEVRQSYVLENTTTKVKHVAIPPLPSQEDSLSQLTEELKSREQQLGPENPLLRDTIRALIQVYVLWRNPDSDSVDPACVALFERLESMTQVPASEDPEEEWTRYCYEMWFLQNAYGDLGDTQKQKELLERALQIDEQHYGPDHYQVARTLGSLASAYGHLGDIEKVKELLERALQIKEQYYGPNHYQVARSLGSLGSAYGNLGDIQKQKELLERALQIQEQHYGSDHYQLATTLMNLGIAYGDLGDIEKAKELLERALQIQEQHYGPEHYQLATTLTNLGIVYDGLGDIQNQKALLERALQIQEQHYGPDHYRVARTLMNLGTLYGDLGDIRKMKELLVRALQIDEQHYGPDHYQVAYTLMNLGVAYGALGDTEKVKELLERSLQIQEQHYGPDHYQVVATLMNLGNAYGDLGNFPKHKEVLERALQIEEQHYSPDHCEVAAIRSCLGDAYNNLGNYEMAKEMLGWALRILQQHYGPDHLEVTDTLMFLGSAYCGLGDTQKSKEVLERALQIREQHYGPDHYEVATTLVRLGKTYMTMEETQKAKEVWERALQIQDQWFDVSSKHHITESVLKELMEVYRIRDDQTQLYEIQTRLGLDGE